MKKLAAMVVAAAMIATAVASIAPTAAVSKTQRAAIGWGRCDDAGLRQAGARCAMLDVPLDYSDPGGTQIQLALSRIKHTIAGRQVPGRHAGEPRWSGWFRSRSGDARPVRAGARRRRLRLDRVRSPRRRFKRTRDLVRPRLLPRGPPGVHPHARRASSPSGAAVRRSTPTRATPTPRPLLPHMTTIDSAKDMDSIRPRSASHRSTTTGSPTARTWDRSTPRCSRARPPHGVRQQR